MQDPQPEIVVMPMLIDFGNIESGQETGVEQLTIVNAGDEVLLLDPLSLIAGNDKFSIDHDAYTDMQNLTFKLLEIVETFQAPVHDDETRKLREQDFDLINLLYEIVSRSENILKLILKFKTK